MPRGIAVTSRLAMAPNPTSTSPDGSGGWTPTVDSDAATSGAFITPVAQPSAVPTITAARPAGMLPGNRMPAVQPTSTRVSDTNAIHGTSHDWNAGRMEMNAIEMPAS